MSRPKKSERLGPEDLLLPSANINKLRKRRFASPATGMAVEMRTLWIVCVCVGTPCNSGWVSSAKCLLFNYFVYSQPNRGIINWNVSPPARLAAQLKQNFVISVRDGGDSFWSRGRTLPDHKLRAVNFDCVYHTSFYISFDKLPRNIHFWGKSPHYMIPDTPFLYFVFYKYRASRSFSQNWFMDSLWFYLKTLKVCQILKAVNK